MEKLVEEKHTKPPINDIESGNGDVIHSSKAWNKESSRKTNPYWTMKTPMANKGQPKVI
jgi:hypothetical protein